MTTTSKTVAAEPGISPLLVSDLTIQIFPLFCTIYHGTAAQLIAEGVIPDGFKWPTDSKRVDYELGKFTYWMGRCRPDGMKGPRSLWINGDYWFMQRSLTSEQGKGCYSSHIYAKKRELAEAIYRGTAEWSRVWSLAYEAKRDPLYMEFRQKITGKSKRGRPGKPAV